ncbi:RraA family protein [Methylobacterium sp. JK268]
MPVTLHAAPADSLPDDLVARWRAVPVAVAVDLARAIGQVDPAIRPLRPAGQQPRLFGRAVTALCEPPDFGAVLHAVDAIAPGDVLVIAAGGHAETAMIGEIVGGHLRRRGGVGLVCDGAVRDVGVLAGFDDLPVFTRCVTPRGPSSAERGAVNAAVVVGGALVAPGDLVIGDDDGLVVLTPDQARARIGDAEAKLAREAGWEASFAAGRSMRETFGLPAPVPAPKSDQGAGV